MSRYRRAIFSFIGMILFCFTPFGGASHAGVYYITPKTLYWWMEYGEAFTLINTSSYLECLDAKIPKSLCLSCDEREKVKTLVPPKKETKIVLYDSTREWETFCPLVDELTKQGYRQIYILQGGLPAWKMAGFETESVERIPRIFVPSIKAKDLDGWLKIATLPLLLDIRMEDAFRAGHIEGAINIPLSLLHRKYPDIPLNRSLVIIDADGTKSLLAASYLSRKGFRDMKRLAGGMVAWEKFRRAR